MCILHRGELVVQGSVRELLDRDSIAVRITMDPLEQGMELLRSMAWVRDLRAVDGQCACSVPEAELARTNSALVQAGIAVSGFAPRRSLEDYFLSITEAPEGGKPA
jgi:ABC-type multidrug transport system ATPase subunit